MLRAFLRANFIVKVSANSTANYRAKSTANSNFVLQNRTRYYFAAFLFFLNQYNLKMLKT